MRPGARVLVTGAAGFVGRAVTACLSARGYAPVPLPCRLAEMDGLRLRVDAVIHLAAVSRPADFAGRPQAWETNVAGTLAVANFCLRQGAGMVFASTSGVYARPETAEPLSETAPPRPASDYAASKLAAEQLLARHCRDTGLACLILRLFNPYGPGQDHSFAVPGVVEAILRNRPVPLAQPDAVRDFVAVEDAALAFAAGLAVLAPGRCPVVNVGSGIGVSIRELALLTQSVLAREAVMAVNPDGVGKGGCVVADTTLAETFLRWRAQTPLREGIRNMAATG